MVTKSSITQAEIKDALPAEGKKADTVGNAALVIQIINGIDMLLSYTGVVPPGAIPAVVNGIVAIGAGITQWWAKRKVAKEALYATPPSR